MPRQKVARHLRYWIMLGVAACGNPAIGSPPVDPGSAGRSHSRTDRAIESRLALLGANRGSSPASVGASGSIAGNASTAASSVGATASSTGSQNAGGTTGTIASETGRDTATPSSSNTTGAPNGVMTDRSRRPDASFAFHGATARGLRGDAPSRNTSTSPTGAEARVHAKVGPDQAVLQTNRALRRAESGTASKARSAAAHEAHEQRPNSTKAPRSFSMVSRAHLSRSEKSSIPDSDSTENAVHAEAPESHKSPGRESHRMNSQTDLLLNRRLAQIDRMRDDALASGDTDKLREADRLELLARQQYSGRTTGERKVGSTMKDFNRQPRPAEISPDSGVIIETEENVVLERSSDVEPL
jgi:hypothetical protein